MTISIKAQLKIIKKETNKQLQLGQIIDLDFIVNSLKFDIPI